jgi:L-asparaginase
LVTFNEQIHPARDVTKVHSTNVDTFRSPECGPLGVIDENRVTWLRRSEALSPTLDPDAEQLTNAVHAVTVTADMNPAQIRAAGDAAALCFATTGVGHIPPSIVDPLSDLKDAGFPLIATTRCPEERLARRTYGFRGSEATLKELDCYFSLLNLQKTRIASIIGTGADSLESLFEQP